MIKPTVGRVVWYRPGADGAIHRNSIQQPLAAIVTYVWNDRMVNLAVFDHNGNTNPRTSVQLIQEGDEIHAYNTYCEWMPYQVGQAKKHDAEAKTS